MRIHHLMMVRMSGHPVSFVVCRLHGMRMLEMMAHGSFCVLLFFHLRHGHLEGHPIFLNAGGLRFVDAQCRVKWDCRRRSDGTVEAGDDNNVRSYVRLFFLHVNVRKELCGHPGPPHLLKHSVVQSFPDALAPVNLVLASAACMVCC